MKKVHYLGITDIALKNSTSVFVLTALISLFGLAAYVGLPREMFPSMKQPIVSISTAYYGVAPGDIESLVTHPIEKKLGEITDIRKLTSQSFEGYSSIVVEFDPHVQTSEALAKVRDKVDQSKAELPTDAQEPMVVELDFDNFPILLVNLSADYGLARLKEVAEFLEDEYEAIPGVLSVDVTGGLEREVKVNLNPARMNYYDIPISDVTLAIQKENVNIPGGNIESGDINYLVRIPGEFETPKPIEDIVVKQFKGNPVYLRDLGTVIYGFKERTSYSRLEGSDAITLSVKKRGGANIIDVVDGVKDVSKKFSSRVPKGTTVTYLADFSKDIRRMVNELENSIISGLILVFGVLLFFMGGRNALLVGISIPLSMVLSFLVMDVLGYTLNMISLFSLILALGMLVDNAIVIIENIYRHRLEGFSRFEAARLGTGEVGIAVIASTLTTLMAFGPLIFWPGIMGEFMKFLPITLIITLTSCLFVALVINPVTCMKWLSTNLTGEKQPAADKWLERVIIKYQATLGWALNHRKTTVGLSLASFFGILFLFGLFPTGIEFFPNIEPRQIWINVTTPVGSRIESTNEIVKEIEQRLKAYPVKVDFNTWVADVGVRGGGFSFGGAGGESHRARLTISMIDRADRQQSSFLTMEQLRDVVSGIPGATIEIVVPENGPPKGLPVNIQLLGEDFSKLGETARKIRRMIQNVPDLVNLKDSYDLGRPELTVRVDREKAGKHGLSTQLVSNNIRTAFNGVEASKYRVGKEEYDITVRFEESGRNSINKLENLFIFHEGQHYPISNFATLELSSGLGSIAHLDRERIVEVTGETPKGKENRVLDSVKARIAGFQLPPGVRIQYGGQDEEQKKAEDFLTKVFFVVVFGIFLILVTQFNSVALPFVIILSVLLSFIGVFFGLMVTQQPFGIIMTGVGVISLAGVVVNNSIVLLDYTVKLRERGVKKLDAIVQAGSTRLRPVLLTAITTMLGLIPLTIGFNFDFIRLFTFEFDHLVEFGGESSQYWSGMGIAVIFGLGVATMLTLVVVPVLYSLFSVSDEKFHARDEV